MVHSCSIATGSRKESSSKKPKILQNAVNCVLSLRGRVKRAENVLRESSCGNNMQFLDLPDEIVSKIMCFTDARTIVVCSTVNRALRRLCLDLWETNHVFVANGRQFEAWARTVQHLDVQIQAPSGMKTLARMHQLRSLHCSNLTTVMPLDSLRYLAKLDVSESCSIVEVDALTTLTQMKELRLRGLAFMQNICTLNTLVNLEILDLCHCHSLSNIDSISHMSKLSELNLRNCVSLESLPSLVLPPLKFVDLQACIHILDLEPLVDCGGTLITLMISKLQIAQTEALGYLTKLEVLEMNGCAMISHMQDIANIVSLKRFSCKSSKLWDITPIANLTALTYLDLSSSTYILEIGTIRHLTNLEYLNLSGNRHAVSEIGPLRSLILLRTLYLTMCKVQDISAIGEMKDLESLSLAFCMRITDIRPLAYLSALRRLDLDFCRGIVDLSALRNLPNLESLSTEGLLGIGRGRDFVGSAFSGTSSRVRPWSSRAWAKFFPAA
eukprot:CFRG5258T1